MITRAAVGLKDQTRALYDVLGAVFRKPDLRFRATAAAIREDPASGATVPLDGALKADAEAGMATREAIAAPAAAMRRDLFANAACAVRAAYFQDLMGQVRMQKLISILDPGTLIVQFF